jgi:hypothetical protein
MFVLLNIPKSFRFFLNFPSTVCVYVLYIYTIYKLIQIKSTTKEMKESQQARNHEADHGTYLIERK